MSHRRLGLFKKPSGGACSEATAVLARYTGLTSRETLAISRLVCNSVDNGNWALMDEVFMFGLYTEANALIGMKAKTATPINNPVLRNGKGFKFSKANSSYLDSNFNPLTDAVNYTLNEAVVGNTFNDTDEVTIGSISQAAFGCSGSSGTYSAIGTSGGPNVNIKLNSSNNITRTYVGAFKDGAVMIFNRVDSNTINTYFNGALGVLSNTVTEVESLNIFIGARNLSGAVNIPSDFTIGSWFIGGNIDSVTWGVDIQQAVNELEIGKADLVDYNVQDKTYHWDLRELLSSQLEELVTIINANCDSTTTGRILDLTGHLGITSNAQTQIDDMVNNKLWTVNT